MKKLFWFFPIAILLVGFYTEQLLDDRAKALLQMLKLSEDNANSTIFSDISSSTFYLPGIKELKSIALSDRASQVGVIGNYVKDFTASKDFIKRYNEYRELRKPAPPEKPKTMEELKIENSESLKTSLEEMKSSKSQAPADQKAMFDESIKYLEEQLKAIDDPNNTMYTPEMDTYMQEAYQQQMEQHKKEIAEWEAKYPANIPNGMIKTWLKDFIDKTKNVDFSAKTAIDENGRTLFVKQDYERKDNLWKLCFRAGKETTESARKFAQTWLGEL